MLQTEEGLGSETGWEGGGGGEANIQHPLLRGNDDGGGGHDCVENKNMN